MLKFIKNIFVISAFIGLGIFLGVQFRGITAVAQSIGLIPKMNISKAVSVSSTSTVVLPASSGRQYAAIVNDGTEPVYLGLDGNAAVAGAGIRLNASGGAYEINSLNQDIGVITAITASSTSSLTVTAFQ